MISSWYIIYLMTITSLVSLGQGFFLYGSKKSQNVDRSAPNNAQWPPYSTRAEALWPSLGLPGQSQPTYAFDATTGSVTVALPVAVPIPAQLSTAAMSSQPMSPPAYSPPPAATFHNVQLVPCLCPITKDFDPIPQPSQAGSSSNPSYVIQNSSPP